MKLNTGTQEDDFIEILEKYKKLIFKIANLYGQSQEDKKDLVQEIILQLWKAFPKYNDAYALSTWIYRIALNVSISLSRKRRTRAKTHHAYEKYHDIIHWEDNSLEPNVEQLYKLIEQLKSLDKAIVILYLEGHKNLEIAEIMGMTSTNISTRLNRIKEQLTNMFNNTNDE